MTSPGIGRAAAGGRAIDKATSAGWVPVLVITGPVGAGKTTVADEISELLLASNFAHAVIDMDRLRMSRPTPADDRFGERSGRRNLAALWPLLQADGARCLVIADVVENRADYLRELTAAVPRGRPVIVRLQVPMDEIIRRLRHRETAATLDWHLGRAPELQQLMERGQVQDLLIEAGIRGPVEIAREILDRTGIG